jgi:hypothetical protein
MSRSRRKKPILGITTAASEQQDKRLANRKLRRRLRQIPPDEDAILPEQREVSNIWAFDKDGKRWLHDPDPRWMRK